MIWLVFAIAAWAIGWWVNVRLARGGPARWRSLAAPVVFGVTLIAVWEGVVRGLEISPVLLPTPTVDGAGPGVEGPSAEGPSAEGPSAEGPSAEDVFNLLDGNGDGFITEDELRGAAEKGGIALTDEQVAAFMAADADGDGVEIDEFLNSLDESQEGITVELSLAAVTALWGVGLVLLG